MSQPRRLTIFHLPPELRQQIYLHALLPQPSTVTHLTPSDIYISLPLPAAHQASLHSGNYWSSRALQKRLRLLRTHSAVRAEASALLYARFAFAFPPWDDECFFRALADWLKAPAPGRRDIRAIRLSRSVDLAAAAGADRRAEHVHAPPSSGEFSGPRDFHILARHLLHLRTVAIDVRFHGAVEVLEDAAFERAVQRVLALARPFFNPTGRGEGPRVEFRVSPRDDGGQWALVLAEVRRRMESGRGWVAVPKVCSGVGGDGGEEGAGNGEGALRMRSTASLRDKRGLPGTAATAAAARRSLRSRGRTVVAEEEEARSDRARV